jgi:hypothetical protein
VKLHQRPKKCQLPGQADMIAVQDFCTHEYRVRRIAGQCRVSLATAETIVANACFSDGERRR